MVRRRYRLEEEQVREEADEVQQKIGGDGAQRAAGGSDDTDAQESDIRCEIALVLAHDFPCLVAEDR
ncbi:hypothetical protein [Trinickia mobilis]|uniref:hypothetical protein n=1 Tax=Trinickia mobilis TaxID=2816356 RepID=UPI001F5C51CE|nr:hypothetical protein [Trinickia mobilis]